MSEQIGDIAETHKRTVKVNVVHPIDGQDTAWHFKLRDKAAISHYLSAFASVKITGPIEFHLSAPISSTQAAVSSVAVVPDKYDDWPTIDLQVRELEGAITIKDALLVPASLQFQGSVREVADILQPKTLVDFPPVVVGHLRVAGGSASTRTYLTAVVSLTLDGVAHRKTW